MSRQKKEIREPAVNPKQSDRRIRDFEKQLDILYEAFNKTPVGIAVINKHVFIEVNRRFCGLVGYERDYLLDRDCRLIFPTEDDYNKFALPAKDSSPSTAGYQAATTFRHKNGGVLHILLWVVPIGDSIPPETFYCTAVNLDEYTTFDKDSKNTFDLYRIAWDQSFDGMRLVDETGRIVIVNRAFCDLVGKPRQELEGQLLSVMYDTEHGQSILSATIQRLKNNQIVPHFERQVTLWNGQEVWVELSNSIIEVIWGRRMLLSIFRDLTERRKSEKQIRLLAQATASVGECISITDLEDRLIYVNPEFERTYGYTSDELIGKPITEMIRPVNRPMESVTHILPDTLKGYGWKGELLNRRKDGREFPVALSTSSILDDHGQPIALMGIARDITERKRAENDLRESERKLATLIANLPGAAFRCQNDDQWTMLFMSNGCLALTGYPPEDIVKNRKISYNQIIHPDDREFVHDEINAALGEKKSYQLLYRIVTADQKEKWVWEQGTGVFDDDDNLVAVEGFISDVSERILANAELKRSENRFRSVWEGSFDSMRLTDKDGKILAVNEAFCHQVGMRRSELEGQGMGIIYPLEVRQAVEEKYREHFRERRVKPLVEANITLWNKKNYWFEISSSFIESSNAQTSLLCIFRDVTKRKKSEAEVAESARRFQWLYEYAPIAYHTLTPEGVIVNVNRQWCEIMGYRKEEVVGRQIFDFIVEAERQAAVASFKEKRLTKKFFHGGNERHYVTKSGDIRTFIITDYFSLDENKNIVSIQTTMSDITERKITEEALRQSEIKFRKLVESSMDIIWQVDAEGRLIYFSPNVEPVLGRPASELIGNLLVDVLPENSRQNRRAYITAAFQSKQAIRNQIMTLRGQMDEPIILEINATPTYDTQGEIIGFIGTARDITIQKAAENEQIKSQKLESLSVLAGGIAHDFNNLLVGILGNISLAKMKVKEPDILRIIDQAERAAMRSRNLTQQLLTFAKGGAPVKEVLNIETFLRDTVEFALVGSSVLCKFNIAKALPSVEADRGQLTQVIQNLAINAVQAMPTGGVLTICADSVELTTDSSATLKAGRYIKITINDTGIGIPEKLLSKIFDPYFTTKQHGSGLGLSVVYSIITKHNGQISVESEQGVGTTFTILLPAAERENRPADEFEEVIPHGTGRVLVMDDDEMVCDVAEGLISSLGYQVHCVHDGKAALSAYQEANKTGRPYDIVIMDLTIVGGMGGKETIAELMKIDPQAKVYVSSGYSTDPIMSDPEKYGFKGVIAKPYRLEDLSRTLKIALG